MIQNQSDAEQEPRKRTHLIPRLDGRAHIAGPSCWCHPVEHRDRVVHNSRLRGDGSWAHVPESGKEWAAYADRQLIEWSLRGLAGAAEPGGSPIQPAGLFEIEEHALAYLEKTLPKWAEQLRAEAPGSANLITREEIKTVRSILQAVRWKL